MCSSHSGKHPSFNRRGQLRVVEAIIAASIIIVAMSLSSLFLKTSRVFRAGRSEELSRTAFSVMIYLSKSGSLDSLLVQRPTGWPYALKGVLDSLVPANVLFVATVETFDGTGTWVSLCPPISNSATADVNSLGPEIGSATYVYTGVDGEMYCLRLMISPRG